MPETIDGNGHKPSVRVVGCPGALLFAMRSSRIMRGNHVTASAQQAESFIKWWLALEQDNTLAPTIYFRFSQGQFQSA
jgi:hypothetical protein